MSVEERLAKCGQPDFGLSAPQRVLLSALLDQTARRTGIYSIAPSHPALGDLGGLADREFGQLCRSLGRAIGHPVNFFYFQAAHGRLPFVGFDYRRSDYARDERKGCNKVAEWIAQGVYDRETV
uniref:Uncharacterized protein n=1 Tax=Marseillevirus LCMAC103 TaxID=2506604 RepID=A0A481YUN4_9VIRU|nr:MAG: hypothetical protein LCMAC103_01420 [Marseillevirus LCMAC103]